MVLRDPIKSAKLPTIGPRPAVCRPLPYMNIGDFCFCAAKCVNMPVIYVSCLETQTLKVKSLYAVRP